MPAILDLAVLIIGLAALVAAVVWAVNNVGDKGGRDKAQRTQLRLERRTRFPEGIEETRLLINDRPILAASSDGLRLADYADEVEQLETLATKIADALGGRVELARVSEPGKSAAEEAIPVRQLPRSQQDGTKL